MNTDTTSLSQKFKTYSLSLLLASATALAPVQAASIDFTAGAADLTFFYDSSNNTWDTVFRSKGNTVATGLTNPYAGPPGGVGGSANDYNFSSLNVTLTSGVTETVNGNTYFISPASGSDYVTASQPDLGIRTRLRELDGPDTIDQFAQFGFQMTLTAASVAALNGDFILFQPDGLGNFDILYETASSTLQHDWASWGHTHWNWGFTEPGTHVLTFDFQGLGGEYGPSSIGTVDVQFTVIPEPSTAVFISGFLVLGFVVLRKFAFRPSLTSPKSTVG